MKAIIIEPLKPGTADYRDVPDPTLAMELFWSKLLQLVYAELM